MSITGTVESDDDSIEFLDLPAHLIEIVLTKLDPFSICSLSRTSRLLQKLTSEFENRDCSVLELAVVLLVSGSQKA